MQKAYTSTRENCNAIYKIYLHSGRMSTLQQRITAARELVGLSQSELARNLGVTPQAVQSWESGKSSPRGKRLDELCRLLQVTVTWLVTGDDPRLREASELMNFAPMLQPAREAKEYPVISWVNAGERAESPDNYAPGIAEEWLPSTENAGKHGYWVRVRGKSMTSDTPPSFPEGTPILIQPEGFDLISGKFYIAKHRDGETTFKQYVNDGGVEYLAPLNAAFKLVELDEDWSIIGRVVDAKITGL
ncbi:TPA: LexA family protein [Pseudomonas aeruginosa]